MADLYREESDIQAMVVSRRGELDLVMSSAPKESGPGRDVPAEISPLGGSRSGAERRTMKREVARVGSRPVESWEAYRHHPRCARNRLNIASSRLTHVTLMVSGSARLG